MLRNGVEPRRTRIKSALAILGTLLALNLNLWIADYFFSTGSIAIGFLLPAVLGFIAMFGVLAVFNGIGLLRLKSGPVALVFILPTLMLFAGAGLALGFVYKQSEVAGGTVSGVSVAEARKYRNAAIVRYRDGRVLALLQGQYAFELREGKAYYFAAPIVPEGWSRAQPVPLWAIAYSTKSTPDPATLLRWSQPLRTSLRPTAASSINYRNAVRTALERHKLTTTPDAPLVEWLAFDEAQARVELANKLRAGIFLGFDGLWLVALLAASLVDRSTKPATP